jgi:hypothetical protein
VIRPSRDVIDHAARQALKPHWDDLRACVELQPALEVREVLHADLDRRYEAEVERLVESEIARLG